MTVGRGDPHAIATPDGRSVSGNGFSTVGLLAVIDDIAARLALDDPQSARVKTLSVFALLVGTLQVSRALADRQLADEVLEQGIHDAFALLGGRHQI